MALSSELRQALARSHRRPRSRERSVNQVVAPECLCFRSTMTLCRPMIPTIRPRGFRSPLMSNSSPKSTLCPWPRQSKHLGATPYSGAIKCATIASQSDSSGGRHASSARFARSCGAPLDAVQSCSLYAVRATRTAAVATAGNSRPAGAQGDDRGLRIMGW